MISDEELMAYVDGELDEPARERVSAALAADPALAARVERQRARRVRRWAWQEWSAVAASLVIGVLLAPYVMRASQPLPFISAGGRVVAIGELEDALMRQPSGAVEEKSGLTAIGMSFRTPEGTYCRTFAMTPGPAGLACRQWGEWVIEVLARNPKARQASEGYRQAGTAFPDLIRQAVEARIEGEPLTAEEEARLEERNWRPDRRL